MGVCIRNSMALIISVILSFYIFMVKNIEITGGVINPGNMKGSEK
jgi:hypothetical protein